MLLSLTRILVNSLGTIVMSVNNNLNILMMRMILSLTRILANSVGAIVMSVSNSTNLVSPLSIAQPALGLYWKFRNTVYKKEKYGFQKRRNTYITRNIIAIVLSVSNSLIQFP